uniref:Uncharacterized protein n=1 Tax=Plectus sambesii TaxID=2011161 RepID=A0A914UJV3_9BILA
MLTRANKRAFRTRIRVRRRGDAIARESEKERDGERRGDRCRLRSGASAYRGGAEVGTAFFAGVNDEPHVKPPLTVMSARTVVWNVQLSSPQAGPRDRPL